MLRPSYVSQETAFAVLGLPPRKFLEVLVPRCRNAVVRVGRTVLLPIDAAEAALLSLADESATFADADEVNLGEHPVSVDAVLASVNMRRSGDR